MTAIHSTATATTHALLHVSLVACALGDVWKPVAKFILFIQFKRAFFQYVSFEKNSSARSIAVSHFRRFVMCFVFVRTSLPLLNHARARAPTREITIVESLTFGLDTLARLQRCAMMVKKFLFRILCFIHTFQCAAGTTKPTKNGMMKNCGRK